MRRHPTHRPALLGPVLACALLALPAWAQTYTVEVRPALDGLPVTIDTVSRDASLSVMLTNGGNVKVRCDLRYEASPQPLRRAYVYVKPGETVENVFRAQRKWFRVVVDVACKPSEKS